ncbi:TPA: GEVED domain-containing protein, partial [Streptococcus suis]
MRNHKKKSFDWYGLKQHFSIRKYHFGAASVLLGMSLALGAGAQAVQAEESLSAEQTTTSTSKDLSSSSTGDATVVATETSTSPTTVESSSSQAVVEEASPASVESETETGLSESTSDSASKTVTSLSRSATINYIVKYVLEDGTVVNAVVKSTTVTTTETLAKTSVEVTAELPEGYELAAGQEATVSQEVTENAENIVTVKLVKKAEVQTASATAEKEATKDVTASTTTTSNPISAAPAVTTPVTVEEAKTVLEQVTSETTVLANEGERLVATTQADNTALKVAAADAKTVAAEAEVTLADSLASFEEVNAQIDAVRAKTEALVVELRKLSPDGEIQIALSVSTNVDGSDADGVITDATATPAKHVDGTEIRKDDATKVVKGSESLEDLKQQITWLDFGDTANWTGAVIKKGTLSLAVGATYTKEIMPGYVVTLTVKELKPFIATETFKNRVAGTASESVYNPNAKNYYLNDTVASFGYMKYGADAEASIVASNQDSYSWIADAGINTGKQTAIRSGVPVTSTDTGAINGGNVGVVFGLSATYKGKTVDPNIIMVSGEDIGILESEIYVTNGTPWNLDANLAKTDAVTNTYKVNTPGPLGRRFSEDRYIGNAKGQAGQYYTSLDQTNAGLGTQVISGYNNQDANSILQPVFASNNVSEFGLYIASRGAQSTMVGFVLKDQGDAAIIKEDGTKLQYRDAAHYISTLGSDGTTQIQQPYLGTALPDLNELSGTAPVGPGSDDADIEMDEGVTQLFDKSSLSTDDYGSPIVKFVVGSDNTYSLSLIANANGNDNYKGTIENAYVRTWVDFDQNGIFEDDEASNLATVSSNGEVIQQSFSNTQIIDTNISRVAIRTRIAKNANEIASPYGTAFSGEVEDNIVQVVHPPRGDKETTSGLKGETQTIQIAFHDAGYTTAEDKSGNGVTEFVAYGEKDDQTVMRPRNTMDTSKAVQIVLPDASLSNTYTEAGEGTYTVTGTTITFTPEANFVGTAKGIVLRATDANGRTTGWTALTDQNGLTNVNDGTHTTTTQTMDAVYIPTVINLVPSATNTTSSNVQGAAQTKTASEVLALFTAGTEGDTANATVTDNNANTTLTEALNTSSLTLLDASGNASMSVPATSNGQTVGTYTLNADGSITFQPKADFVGTPDPVNIRMADRSGDTVVATYTPTVTPTTITAEDQVSSGAQGEKQAEVITSKLSENPNASPVSYAFEDGTTSKTVAGQGSYTIDATTGAITFTPEADFIGTATPVTVVATSTITAADGSKTTISDTATYTPTVYGVQGSDDTSENVQGVTQTSETGVARFSSLNKAANTTLGDKEVDFTTASYTLLDENGVAQTSIPVAGEGTYTIDVTTGIVTFVPEASFTGKGTGVTIQITASATDSENNEIPVTATGKYTPSVTPTAIVADDKTSTGLQGSTQTETMTSALKEANPNASAPTYAFEDGTTTKTVAGEGTYTLNPTTGEITFSPKADFVGKATPVTVVASAVITSEDGTTQTISDTATYTPEVTPATIKADDQVSAGAQGQPQTDTISATVSANPNASAPTFAFEDGTTSKTVAGQGSYTIDATTGAITFTPEADFIGTATPVTVVATSTITAADGSKTTISDTATYTPTVYGMTSNPSESANIQGKTQNSPTGAEVFKSLNAPTNTTDGYQSVQIPDKGAYSFEDGTTSKTIDGEGTYTIDPDTGVVTFSPVASFTGKGTGVTVKVTASAIDKEGNTVTVTDTDTYTPTVVPVTTSSKDAVSENVQGITQSGTPTYEISPEANVTAKTYAFEDGSTTKKVDGEGTYTVDPTTGQVTFSPVATFTGTGTGVEVVQTATLTADDGSTTEIKTSATYTPTVKPTTLDATGAVSASIPGEKQTDVITSKLTENPNASSVTYAFDNGSTTKTVDGEGTYTINPTTGLVEFTPEADFIGTATPVEVVASATITAEDGSTATITDTATYTPTIYGIKGEDVTSEDVQGSTQTGTPVFTSLNDATNTTLGDKTVTIPTTGAYSFEDGTTTKTVDGEGTYTVNPDTGEVTFKPVASFTGTGTGVTVKVTATATDSEGNIITVTDTATYTPKVKPAELVAKDAVSADTKSTGQTDSITATLGESNPNASEPTYSFDGKGTTTKTVAGEGTYTIDPATGVVAFTPEANFVGTATPVEVVAAVTITAEDGSTAIITDTATYTPTVYGIKGENVQTEDVQGGTQSGTPVFTSLNAAENTTLGDKTVTIPATDAYSFEDGTTSKTVDGEGTYTINPNTGEVTFKPIAGFTGTGTGVTVKVTATATDSEGNVIPVTDTATYVPTVGQTSITAEDQVSANVQGEKQSDTIKASVSENPNASAPVFTFEDGSTTKTVSGEGTYELNPTTGEITFTPEASFVGTATPVTIKVTSTITAEDGTTADITTTATYTPTVYGLTSEPSTSENIQGKNQTSPEGSKVFESLNNPTNTTNGYQEVVIPTTGAYTLVDGDGNDVSTVTIADEGTYTIDPNTGVVTFSPVAGFTGKGTGVTIKVTAEAIDSEGNKVVVTDTNTYTPEVSPVTTNSTDAETENIQGKTQSGTPNYEISPEANITEKNYSFEDGSTEKVVPGEGTYTVDPSTGLVTFVPETSFTGTGSGVTVVQTAILTADDGSTTEIKTSAKYIPTVISVTPTATPVETTDIQGKTQSGTPVFTPGHDEVPMDDTVPATFEDGTTEKVIPGEGTYTVAPDGTVTFVPEKDFTGTGTGVTVKRVDKNGTPVTATYTPNVTPVIPEGTPVNTVGLQGKTQEGTPVFTPGHDEVPIDETVPATFEDGTTEKVVPGEGTYTVTPEGKVTFVPEKDFVGTGTGVTVKRVDKNGTEVTAKYTPTVVEATPESEGVTSINVQGATQTGTPTFTGGSVDVNGDGNITEDETVPVTISATNPAKLVVDGKPVDETTIDAKDKDGNVIGTYTIDPATGTVTFTPNKDFVGTAAPATVQATDENGKTVTATYTPTVIPVTPTGTPAVSTDIQGKTQTGTPTFTGSTTVVNNETVTVPIDETVPATFEDGSTEKVVPGEGTYTVTPEGKVTFVPEKDFVGTAKGVTVKRVDKNGTPATATYTPTVTPVTPTGTPAESKDYRGKTQTGTPVFTPGHEEVPMDDTVPATFEDGTTEKVVPGEGTYTVAPDGTVTFVPEKDFVGVAKGVTVKRVDKNGTEATATYTPTVIDNTTS